MATALGLILVQNGRWFNEIPFTDGSFGKTAIICGADMSSSEHIYYKGKEILILGEEPT